jgi:hypothetical protein
VITVAVLIFDAFALGAALGVHLMRRSPQAPQPLTCSGPVPRRG